MAKKILVSKNRGDGNPKVFTMINSAIRQLGGDLPEAMEPANEQSLARNRVVEFEGDIYCAQKYNVFKYNSASGSWGLERGGSGIANAENHLDLGMYVSMIGDVPYLYHVFAGAASAAVLSLNKKSSKFASDGEWSEVANISVGQTMFGGDQDTTSPGLLDVYQHNNILYFLYGYIDVAFAADGFNAIYTFNMESETAGSIVLPTPYLGASAAYCMPASFCVHNDRLFLMQYDGVDAGPTRLGGVSILEIVGSTVVRKQTIAFNNSITQSTLFGGEPDWEQGRHVLFSDEENIYMLWHRVDSSSDYGFRLQMYDAPESSETLTPIDEVSEAVLPASVSQTGGQLPDFRTRWTPYVQINESGVNETYIFHTAFGLEGSIGTTFKFNGSGTPLSVVGVGGDSSYSLPNNRQGGGQYEWSRYKQFDSSIESIRPSLAPGHMDIDFRIISGSGQAVTAKLLYDENGEHLNTFATLDYTSSGTISGLDTVTGIVADSGILYTVSWAAQNDGLETGQTFSIMPLIVLA